MSDPLGAVVPLDLAAWRYRELAIPLASSLAYAPSRLLTCRVAFRSLDRRQSFAVTASLGTDGTLAFTLAKDAALWRFLPHHRERGYLAWDATAQLDGSTAQTVALIRSSPCTLYRSETPA